ISNIIDAVGLSPNTDLEYALIKRYLSPSGELKVISFSLSEVIEHPGSDKDLPLMEQDELILFELFGSNRNQTIEGLINELRVHADVLQASQEVTVGGNVRYPGTYPLVENMQVEGLIRAAGGLSEKAFQLRAELSRTEFDKQQERKQYRVDLNLSQKDSLNFTLKSRDVLQIKTIPDWAESKQVTLSGEVKFPGVYPIYKNDTLAALLGRAGGLTEHAYAPGALFTRVDLKKQQAQQLKQMQDRLAEDIAKAELLAANQNSDVKGSADVAEAQKLLSQLKSTAAIGRLVIDLQKILDEKSTHSISLQAGDALVVPTIKNSVTIIGEVQLPISQVFETELGYWDYINRSGGTTDKADEDRIYIIKANGAVKMPESSSWFASKGTQIAPGDTVVVPLDADRLDQIVLWRDMSQILYQIALGAAAVSSL
uniref:SLBB domain-containing protein n=1 Tax=uncultured Paraglaciecola sp. TaxID=1765024 RepID=UPI0025CBD028